MLSFIKKPSFLIIFLLAVYIIIIPTAFASDYCIEDISPDKYKSFIPKPDAKKDSAPLKLDLPDSSATLVLGYKQFSLIGKDGKAYYVAKLNSGDDYTGWGGIFELENDWLYIEGGQYHHIIHLQKNNEQQWIVDKTIRIKKEVGGVFRHMLRYVLRIDASAIERDNLTSLIRVPGRRIYSEGLKRLLFPATMQEFKDGKLNTFSKIEAHTYIGEIPRLKIALFKADDGQLYSYDGVQLKPLINGKVEPYFMDKGRILEQGLLSDLPTFNKSFYAIRKGIYEIVKNADAYELKQIPLSGDKDLFFTKFIPTPDGKNIAILTRGNIFLLSSLEGIYPRSVPYKQINTTGTYEYELPALIPELKAIMFTTGGIYIPEDRTEYYHLLKKCPDKYKN